MARYEEVQEALEPLSVAFSADGGNLEIADCSGTRLEVRLVLGPDACADCLLPPDQIEMMVSDVVADLEPGFEDITVTVK